MLKDKAHIACNNENYGLYLCEFPRYSVFAVNDECEPCDECFAIAKSVLVPSDGQTSASIARSQKAPGKQ